MALLLSSKARDGGIGRGFLDCGEDARITAAAAQAAIQSLDHLCFRRLRMSLRAGRQFATPFRARSIRTA